jgi:hypothetical protein
MAMRPILVNSGKCLTSQALGPKLEWVRRNEPDVWGPLAAALESSSRTPTGRLLITKWSQTLPDKLAMTSFITCGASCTPPRVIRCIASAPWRRPELVSIPELVTMRGRGCLPLYGDQ